MMFSVQQMPRMKSVRLLNLMISSPHHYRWQTLMFNAKSQCTFSSKIIMKVHTHISISYLFGMPPDVPGVPARIRLHVSCLMGNAH
jgi:hypothetical protein